MSKSAATLYIWTEAKDVLAMTDSRISVFIRKAAIRKILLKAYQLGLEDGRKALDTPPSV